MRCACGPARAAGQARELAIDRENQTLVYLHDLVRRDPVFRVDAPPLSESRANCVGTVEDAGALIGCVYERVGPEEPQNRTAVPAIHGLEYAPDDLHVLPRHRLPPFLGKALGGCTGSVDVEVERRPYDQAIHPLEDARVPHLYLTAAANWTAPQDDHAKGDSVAEVKHLLRLKPKLLI